MIGYITRSQLRPPVPCRYSILSYCFFKRCTKNLSRINTPKLQIDCRSEGGVPVAIPGRFLHIRDERKVHDFYFALCEIQVFSLPGTLIFFLLPGVYGAMIKGFQAVVPFILNKVESSWYSDASDHQKLLMLKFITTRSR